MQICTRQIMGSFLSSPHTRGDLSANCHVQVFFAFHPRIHGATLEYSPAALHSSLSSPHTRGDPDDLCRCLCCPPFIPAYTGRPEIERAGHSVLSFHPRIHGATPWDRKVVTGYVLSSPHTRGDRRSFRTASRRKPFIPAYTGRPASARSTRTRFVLSSPHTRGDPRSASVPATPVPFIPAYTGRPRKGRRSVRALTFHPRIHGATSCPRCGLVRRHLSSPHTRGDRL